MNRGRGAIGTVAVLLAAGLTASPARAEVPGQIISGDFNADGVPDRATLGSISPNLCSTIVQNGSATGDEQLPIAYAYLQPNGGGTPNCPGIGVALNLDGDPADELWLGWSRGAPATLSFNRLVLDPPTFAPAARYTSGIIRPTFMGRAEFSPDGRFSPYDVGPGGVRNFLVTGSEVVPGPVAFCTVDAPAVLPSDFNRDDVDGLLITYRDLCADHSSGVARIHHDGTVAQILQSDPTGKTTWRSWVVHANDDRFFDAQTVNQVTGEVDYFINRTEGTATELIRSPAANTDRVTLDAVRALAIDVLDNDFVSRYAEVTVITPPRYGTTQVRSDRRIVYRPSSSHGRTDRFTYQVTEEGKRSNARVTIHFPDPSRLAPR